MDEKDMRKLARMIAEEIALGEGMQSSGDTYVVVRRDENGHPVSRDVVQMAPVRSVDAPGAGIQGTGSGDHGITAT